MPWQDVERQRLLFAGYDRFDFYRSLELYLFFDTETSDLPRNWNAPESDTRNWPRLVQLAWIAADAGGNITNSQVHLIRPNGFRIATSAAEVHGITTEFAQVNGVDLLPVLQDFLTVAREANIVVAHNIDFDLKIIGAELVRAELSNPLRRKKYRCTMKETTHYCRIPSRYGYKWPTLSELYRKAIGKALENSHDAGIDCRACMECYFKLKSQKVMT